MSRTTSRTTVVLVDLPGVYKGILEEQFRRLQLYQSLVVRHLTAGGARGFQPDDDAVIVVAANSAALRRATDMLAYARILGTIAVTDDTPRGDAYIVSSVGNNMSAERLAELIRDVALRGAQLRPSSSGSGVSSGVDAVTDAIPSPVAQDTSSEQ